MKVARRSSFTGTVHELDLPITEEQIVAYQNGALIQVAFPDLEPWQREFLMLGVTKEEWDAQFGTGSSDRNALREKMEKVARGG